MATRSALAASYKRERPAQGCPAGPWQFVRVGLQLFAPDTMNTFDMWVDEIAISPSCIRCET